MPPAMRSTHAYTAETRCALSGVTNMPEAAGVPPNSSSTRGSLLLNTAV
jgi:hypothetical protein